MSARAAVARFCRESRARHFPEHVGSAALTARFGSNTLVALYGTGEHRVIPGARARSRAYQPPTLPNPARLELGLKNSTVPPCTFP